MRLSKEKALEVRVQPHPYFELNGIKTLGYKRV
jgi:hypothetical protein